MKQSPANSCASSKTVACCWWKPLMLLVNIKLLGDIIFLRQILSQRHQHFASRSNWIIFSKLAMPVKLLTKIKWDVKKKKKKKKKILISTFCSDIILATFTTDTNYYYRYSLPPVPSEKSRNFSFEFRAKARNDVHLGMARSSRSVGADTYEIGKMWDSLILVMIAGREKSLWKRS